MLNIPYSMFGTSAQAACLYHLCWKAQNWALNWLRIFNFGCIFASLKIEVLALFKNSLIWLYLCSYYMSRFVATESDFTLMNTQIIMIFGWMPILRIFTQLVGVRKQDTSFIHQKVLCYLLKVCELVGNFFLCSCEINSVAFWYIWDTKNRLHMKNISRGRKKNLFYSCH